MSPVIAVIGLLLAIAWALDAWAFREASRRKREARAREQAGLGRKPWWKEPPGDPPEGDH